MAASQTPSELVRLHKRIAESGLCSRRAAEGLISEGRVAVNGKVVREMGVKVTLEDEVLVDGVAIGIAKTYTLMMNKPVGYVTTLKDPQGRPTVARILPDLGVMLKPVGRLDMDSEGLILFTNDGELANRLAHPRYGIEKEYEVIVHGLPDEKSIQKLRDGIYIETGKTSPAKVFVLNSQRERSKLKFIIHEGKKRQIRLMCEAIGNPVISLRRVRYGHLTVKGLTKGECRMLGQKDVQLLKKMVGLD